MTNYNSIFLFITAGTPAIKLYGGTSFVTTLPAATTEHSPIVTPGNIIDFAPIQQLSLIITGELIGGYNLLNLLYGPLGSADVNIVTP